MTNDILATLKGARALVAESWSQVSIGAHGYAEASPFRAVTFDMHHAIQRSAPYKTDGNGKPDLDERYWDAVNGAIRAIRKVWGSRPERPEFDSLSQWETEFGKAGVLSLLDGAARSHPQK